MTLREQVFTKKGYEIKYHEESGMYYCADPTGKQVEVYQGIYFDISSTKEGVLATLPPIDSHWEITAKYLVPFMSKKGYKYSLESDGYFWWIIQNNKKMWIRVQGAELKDDNIAEAACEAFMEVKL